MIEINQNKLKDLITSKRQTASTFALNCGLDQASLSKILTGKSKTLSLSTAIRICDYVGIVDVRELLMPYEKFD
jgi:DNA-binding Xre family transcriptional regulator